jgi:hypothetical protein
MPANKNKPATETAPVDVLATVDIPAVAEAWGCGADDPTFRKALAFLRGSQIVRETATDEDGKKTTTIKSRPGSRWPFVMGIPSVSLSVKENNKARRLDACELTSGRSKGQQRDLRGQLVVRDGARLVKRGNWYALLLGDDVVAMVPAIVATVDKQAGSSVEAPFQACSPEKGGYLDIPLNASEIKRAAEEAERVKAAAEADSVTGRQKAALAKVGWDVKKGAAILAAAPFNMPAPIALSVATFYCDEHAAAQKAAVEEAA